MNPSPLNQKISKSRSKDWQKSLVAGKLASQLRPSKLRILRAKQGRSQIAIAKDLGLSTSTYLAIERGRRLVTNSRAKEISKFFGKKPESLFKSFENTVKFVAIVEK